MKNILLTVLFISTISIYSYGQEEDTSTMSKEVNTEVSEIVEENQSSSEGFSQEESAVEDKTFTQIIKEKFIEGGPLFMGIVLVCLILGLAITIERIIYLNLSTINTKKLLANVEEKVKVNDMEGAKAVCKDLRGPIASIFYQGLSRHKEGVEIVEKTISSYGGVQMGLLEKGISWIALFIALAPMLGFMGTVIGMIDAFDAIAEAGDISPGVVAGGIKVALLTTVFGLIVAIILQIFYNYIISKVDSLVNNMEDASISLIDILLENKVKES